MDRHAGNEHRDKDTTLTASETTACVCPRVRIGREVTESRNLDVDCPVHGAGTGYWCSPGLVAERERSVEMQRRAARARRIAADPDAASDSDKLRSIADRIDYDDDRYGRTGNQAQDFLRALADTLERSDSSPP